MVMMVETFERLAAQVSERTADLLCARVAVTDDRGTVVASNSLDAVGRPFIAASSSAETPPLRVPIRLGTQVGEVIVAEPAGGEAIPLRLAQALVELIVNQTALVARLPNQHELKNKFIHDVLHGSAGDEADVLREAQILGMDFSRPRAVILIDAADYILAPPSRRQDSVEARSRRRAQLVIASVVGFFNLPNDTICAYIGDGEVAVLKASSTQDLVAWTDYGRGPDVSPTWANLAALKRAGEALVARLGRDTSAAIDVGIGRYHPGLQGLARSYVDARAALSLGGRFHGHNRVHCLDGLGLASFVGVADERTKIDLATHLLAPLDEEPELLGTLAEFFAQDCCPSATARELSIHRNTLTYRLNKAALLTGLEPRHFDDAVQIRLALVLRSLEQASGCAIAQ